MFRINTVVEVNEFQALEAVEKHVVKSLNSPVQYNVRYLKALEDANRALKELKKFW